MKQIIRLLQSVRALKAMSLTTLIFCSSFIYSQSALNILDLYSDPFPNKNARIITANARIGDQNFHAKIAGISFQAIASPVRSINEKSISLDFADNSLVVKIGSKLFFPDLPYWQLAPIVNFVNSSFNVAFSQLGDTIGNREAKCKFHPAFLDNLLGLRLFQADLLNLTDFLWDIPIDAQRNYILAQSEKGFIPFRDPNIHQRIYDKLETGAFSSFTLTDKDVKVIFDVSESEIIFSGKPYYYFAKTKIDTTHVRLVLSQLINCYNDIDANAKILLKERYSPDLSSKTNLKGLLEVLNKNKKDGIFNPYTMYGVERAISKLDSLNRLTDAQIGIQFQTLDDFSESFKPYWDLLKIYNPLVYSAVENTAHWSAFFRLIRKANPSNWAIFVRKVETNGSWDAPKVNTPTSTEINYFRFFDEREKK